MRSRFSLVVCLVAAVGLASCSIRKPVSTHAVNYNMALELAQNRVMLLNVVRASKYEPRHYTALTQVRSDVSSGFTPTLSVPIGGDATNLFPLGLEASGSSGGTADVAVLDSKTFVQGILNAVGVDHLDYYLGQGWPPEFLLTLFVRKLVYDGTTYVNYPAQDFVKVEEFIEKIRELIGGDMTGLEIVTPSKGRIVGPEFDRPDPKDLALSALEADKAGLALECFDPDKERDRPESDDDADADDDANADDKNADADDANAKEVRCQFRQKSPAQGLRLGGRRMRAEQEARTTARNVIFFRSTEAIIYYLGEIVRHQKACAPKPVVRWQKPDGTSEDVVLFVARQTAEREDALLEVSYKGSTWIVPANPGVEHRSMAVFTILSQLIGLNKEREDLPTTGVVTVAGG